MPCPALLTLPYFSSPHLLHFQSMTNSKGGHDTMLYDAIECNKMQSRQLWCREVSLQYSVVLWRNTVLHDSTADCALLNLNTSSLSRSGITLSCLTSSRILLPYIGLSRLALHFLVKYATHRLRLVTSIDQHVRQEVVWTFLRPQLSSARLCQAKRSDQVYSVHISLVLPPLLFYPCHYFISIVVV